MDQGRCQFGQRCPGLSSSYCNCGRAERRTANRYGSRRCRRGPGQLRLDPYRRYFTGSIARHHRGCNKKDWWTLSSQQKQTIDELQNKLGVNENALKAFFGVLGEKDVPVEQLTKKLVEIAGSYKEALAWAAPNPSDPPEIAKVRDAVT